MNDKNNNNASINKLTDGPLSYQETIDFAMNMERIESRRREMKSGSSSEFELYLIFGALVCYGSTAVVTYYFDISDDAILPTFIVIWIIYTVLFVLGAIGSSKGSGGKRKK
ncbi:MAG: hypothetical protein ACI4YB_04775 [Oscillospiraceae bacterium]